MQINRYYIKMPYAHVLDAVIMVVNHDRLTHEQKNCQILIFPFDKHSVNSKALCDGFKNSLFNGFQIYKFENISVGFLNTKKTNPKALSGIYP